MATIPYAAPLARTPGRTSASTRPVPRVTSNALLMLLVSIAFALTIALMQLALASQGTATIKYLDVLEDENGMLQAQYDEMQSQAESLRTPVRIEIDATRLGLRPIQTFEYGN